MSRGSKLTTTSYALLGLLAIKPWTSYELTQQMQRSMSRFWPRAESKLYEEPKKLAAHGLAQAAADRKGGRPRTIYYITDKGRTELERWLAEPAEGPVLEFEALLKVFFAEHATKPDLLATLADVEQWAQRHVAVDAAIARGYLAGEGPFPQRVAQITLVGRYLADLADLTGRWAQWATEVVEQWPEEPGKAPPDWVTLQGIARRGDPEQESPHGDSSRETD